MIGKTTTQKICSLKFVLREENASCVVLFSVSPFHEITATNFSFLFGAFSIFLTQISFDWFSFLSTYSFFAASAEQNKKQTIFIYNENNVRNMFHCNVIDFLLTMFVWVSFNIFVRMPILIIFISLPLNLMFQSPKFLIPPYSYNFVNNTGCCIIFNVTFLINIALIITFVRVNIVAILLYLPFFFTYLWNEF